MRWLLEIVAEIVAPTRCAACDGEVIRGALFCEACEPSAAEWEGAGAAFVYGGAVAIGIARLKYRGRADLAPRFGRAAAARTVMRPSIDAVVPVPLHPRRLAERGFNQSALIAAPIARALGVPHAARALERVRNTPKQMELDRARRSANVAGAFVCRAPHEIAGRRVLLVDDVRTTGATLAEASAVLVRAGAQEVVTFAVAAKD